MTIDYKKYWEDDNLNNIVPPSTPNNHPEGWDPIVFIQESLQALTFNSILDFGCGYGRLCKAFDPKNYFGIDLNKHAIEKAQAEHPHYHFQISGLECKDEIAPVDLIFAYTVFLHLDDETLTQTLNKLAEKCQKYFVIAEILGREWRRSGNPPVFNRNKEDYVTLLNNIGLKLDNEYRKSYSRYANNPAFKDKNTDISLLVFTKN